MDGLGVFFAWGFVFVFDDELQPADGFSETHDLYL